VLKRIDHPAVGALLRFREAKQQLSFFIEGWEPYLVDGWLHPSFKLHGTVTGRLSCENPNLQQVPRDENIRSIITPLLDLHGDWVLVEADLSQIELRIAAELAGARSLKKCFVEGIDVHWLTALTEIRRGKGKQELIAKTARQLGCKSASYDAQVDTMLAAGPDACIKVEHGWKELRKKAKAVNFGYLFGMWWKKFKIYARDNYGVIVSDLEAQQSRENFFMLYPELEAWQRRQKTFARHRGYVESLSGRKRRLPYAMGKNPKDPRRMEAERQAVNSPVQGFANELNLMSALQLRKEFDRRTVRIIGTVHDSTLFLVRRSKVVPVVSRMLEIMRRPALMDKFNIEFGVPLEGEAKIGPWGRGVSLEEWKAGMPSASPKRKRTSARLKLAA
jgi:DNA polymerase I-like protein with 3'-5' exonuclease and polymerase domains